MSLTLTTLAAAIDAKQVEFKVTSATGFDVGDRLQVNSERLAVKAVDSTTYWIRAERGVDGTLAVAHGILSPVIVGLPEEFPPIPDWHQYTYGVSGAITVSPGLHTIAKATAAAMTLRAPRYDEEGMVLRIVSATAAIHTITLDSGTFNAGTDTSMIQTKGAIGDSVDLMAINGSWCIVGGGVEGTDFLFPSKSASVSPSKSQSSSPSVSPSASA